MDTDRYEKQCRRKDDKEKSEKKGKTKHQMVRQIQAGTKALKMKLSKGKSESHDREKARKKAVAKSQKKQIKKKK
jgi:hypothetical protein